MSGHVRNAGVIHTGAEKIRGTKVSTFAMRKTARIMSATQKKKTRNFLLAGQTRREQIANMSVKVFRGKFYPRPKKPGYREQHGVIVICRGESDQARTYRALRRQFGDREIKVVTT